MFLQSRTFRLAPAAFRRMAPLFLSCLCVGCAASSAQDAALIGGVSGIGIGAGTGALIAETMSNGDVGQSALVGGAIGIPAGIVLGIAIHQAGQAIERGELDSAAESNTERLMQGQHEIEALRGAIVEEQASIRVEDSRAGYVYDGPTLGNPRR